MHVLGQMVEAGEPGGLVLDLQVIRPNPIVEAEGVFLWEIAGEPLFHTADAATAAVDALVAGRQLLEQATDDHDVREHYGDGADLITDTRRHAPAASGRRDPNSARACSPVRCARVLPAATAPGALTWSTSAPIPTAS